MTKRTIFKLFGIIFLEPITLFLLLLLLLYITPIQNWAVGQVNNYASEKTGVEIFVGHVNLSFPLDLQVDRAMALQRNDLITQLKDTVADIKKTIVNIQLLPLFYGTINVDELNIKSIIFNISRFIPDSRVKGEADNIILRSHGTDLRNLDVMMNHASLDGSKIDLQLNDTSKSVTSKSQNYWNIKSQKLELKNSELNIHMINDHLISA